MVTPGQNETLYGGVPAFGLGMAGRLGPVGERNGSARRRLEVGESD